MEWSGETMWSVSFVGSAMVIRYFVICYSLLLQCLRLRNRLVDRANEVERLLGQPVVLAFGDLLEAANRFIDRDVLAFEARELRRHEERLRQEALDPARARYRQLVLFRQLVDAENRDDVLQVLVALQ